MKVTALGVLLGLVLLQQLTKLPPVAFAWLLLGLIPCLTLCRWFRFALSITCDFLWALYQAHHALHPGLDPALEAKISSFPA
jgi:hypothetical protein